MMLEQKQNTVYEDGWKTLNFIHTKIGSRKFHALPAQSLSEFRMALQMTTQLFLFNNYDFEYKGNRLSDFVPVGDQILQKQAQIEIVLKVFDYRSGKHHLSKVMEVLNDPQLYLYLFATNKKTELQNNKEAEIHRLPVMRFVEQLNIEEIKPQLGSKILSNSSQFIDRPEFLFSLSLSGFNPPPTSQRLNGDLFYIHARTLQGQDLHITACPYGFYLNQSKISNFNPNRSTNHKGIYANLIDLLKEVSEKFRNSLEDFLAKSTITDAIKYKFQSIERIKKQKWLQNLEHEHGWNSKKNFVDTHIKVDLLSLKDWNQSFQIEHLICQQKKISQEEKLAQLQKIYAEFESAAVQGAVFLVDGKISPLNPTDEKKKHIYIYNKIFFSIANETPYDHSQEKGEDATPSSSAINTDLNNIQVLLSLGLPSLHILHTMIISYRGFKVIAQCIIPGILSVDQQNCSQYGSIDDGKTIENNPEFEKIMIEVCQKLHLQDNITVEDQHGNKKRIAGSPDIKGILGSDKRKYILDLLRLSPRDLNYEGPKNETCIIRRQLLKKYFEGKDINTLAKINTNIGTDIKFEENQSYAGQKHLLIDIADYLRKTAIPTLINALKTSPSKYLTDNYGITKAFHMCGVNMRYLGQVCQHQMIKYEPQIKLVLQRIILVRSLKQFLRMAMRQSSIMHLGATIVHILNSIFAKKNYLVIQEEGINLELNNEQNNDKDAKKKKKKKTKDTPENYQENGRDFGQIINVIKVSQNKYITMKPNELWAEVCRIAQARYSYELPQNIQHFEVFKFPFQKIATLRDLCLIVGIVLQKKNYDLFQNINHQSDKIPPFNIRNIVSLQPRPKHIQINPVNLQARQRESESYIEKYQVKEALKLDTILQKQNMLISGGLNQTAIRLYTRMSRILYILGDHKAAIAQEQKNISILESLCHQDHTLIVQSHLNLGLYYIGINDKERVIYHMKKSLFLMLIAFGETSPDLLICLANLARIYQMNKQYLQAIKCYDVTIYYIKKIHGKFHVKMSFCYTSLASISYEMGNLKKAIDYQTQNVGILSQIFTENDSRLQDGIKILKMYRQMNLKAEMQASNAVIGNQIVKPENKKVPEEKGKKKQGKK